VAIFLFLLSQICSWTINGIPGFYTHHDVVRKLAQTLTVLKDYHVTQYRNQDWCHVLIYQKGTYWTSSVPLTRNCAYVGGYEDQIPQSPFSQTASDDFTTLNNLYFWTGIRVRSVYVEYDSSGEILSAQFNIQGLIIFNTSYMYSPKTIPSDIAGEVENDFIEPGWYYQVED
jgi:hypothetical protein